VLVVNVVVHEKVENVVGELEVLVLVLLVDELVVVVETIGVDVELEEEDVELEVVEFVVVMAIDELVFVVVVLVEVEVDLLVSAMYATLAATAIITIAIIAKTTGAIPRLLTNKLERRLPEAGYKQFDFWARVDIMTR